MLRSGKYGVLNVVCQPHPDDTYRRLFEAAGRDPRAVKYRSDRFAKTSAISEVRNGVFTGRLATWQEIDENSTLIEKRTLTEQPLSKAEFQLPDGIGFNARVFSFAFRIVDHRLYIELKNDENDSLSVKSACKALNKILKQSAADLGVECDVFLVTQNSGIQRIFSIPRMRKIEILLEMPNPDVLSHKQSEIIESLKQANAKKFKTEVTKLAGADSLELSEGMTVLAELASSNGYVKGYGKDDDGNRLELNSLNFPEEVDLILSEDESRAAATRRLAEHRPLEQ